MTNNQDQIVTVDEIRYRLKLDGTAVVEKDAGSPWIGREIRIREFVQNHKVVGIEAGVFAYREKLRRIMIPATVTQIGNNALPRGRWEQVLIGYQEEYGWNRRGSFPMYGNEIVPIVWVISGSYAETYCQAHDIKYIAASFF